MDTIGFVICYSECIFPTKGNSCWIPYWGSKSCLFHFSRIGLPKCLVPSSEEVLIPFGEATCLFLIRMTGPDVVRDWESVSTKLNFHFVIMGFLRFSFCSFIASLLQNITSCMPAIDAHFFYCRKCPSASWWKHECFYAFLVWSDWQMPWANEEGMPNYWSALMWFSAQVIELLAEILCSLVFVFLSHIWIMRLATVIEMKMKIPLSFISTLFEIRVHQMNFVLLTDSVWGK